MVPRIPLPSSYCYVPHASRTVAGCNCTIARLMLFTLRLRLRLSLPTTHDPTKRSYLPRGRQSHPHSHLILSQFCTQALTVPSSRTAHPLSHVPSAHSPVCPHPVSVLLFVAAKNTDDALSLYTYLYLSSPLPSARVLLSVPHVHLRIPLPYDRIVSPSSNGRHGPSLCSCLTVFLRISSI